MTWLTHTRGMAALAVSLGAATGCFYTEPINQRPVARIARYDEPPCDTPPFHAGDTVCFDAKKSTDNHRESLVARWLVVRCPIGGSDDQCQALDDPGTVEYRPEEIFELPIADKGELHVQLTVVDDLGARSLPDVEVIDAENQAPEVELQAPEPWVVGAPVTVYAQVTDEDDDAADLELSWEYFAPDGSRPDQVVFEEVDATTYSLTPDVEGLWQVQLTATDPDGGEGVAKVPIAVSRDTPPCIGLTDPAAIASSDPDEVESSLFVVDRDQGARRFAVLTVEDELDPYPGLDDPDGLGGEASFSWQIASPDTGGTLVPLAGHEASDYILDPSGFAPGDRVSLRVEVQDRTARTLCPADEPTCAIDSSAPDCFQRLTWEVEIR